MTKVNKKIFTLIEVIVALAVLLAGLTGLMGMFANSSQRATRAMQKWENSHALTQGCEYFMLDPESDSLPKEYDPDQRGLKIVSESVDPELPEGVADTLGNYSFIGREVKVLDGNNSNELGSRHLEMITLKSQ